MPRWLVRKLDNKFRPGGTGTRREQQRDQQRCKDKSSIVWVPGFKLGSEYPKHNKNWSYVRNCPHLRFVGTHRISYLGHNSPNIAKGTTDLKVKYVRQLNHDKQVISRQGQSMIGVRCDKNDKESRVQNLTFNSKEPGGWESVVGNMN